MTRRDAMLRAGCLTIGISVAGLTAQAQTGFESGAPEKPLPPPAEILSQVRDAFPREPLHLEGELITHSPEGNEEHTRRATLDLEWGLTPPRARFEISDAFGVPRARMTVSRPARGAAAVDYAAGNPPVPCPAPPATEAVEGTEFLWGDLGLDFLWWAGGATKWTEMKKTRLCYVVDLPAPAGQAYASVRLWIDAQAMAVLQADAFDAAGKTVRRLEAKSVKKVDGRWVVQDIEVRNLKTGRATTLRVTSSRLGAGSATPDDKPEPVGSVHPTPVS